MGAEPPSRRRGSDRVAGAARDVCPDAGRVAPVRVALVNLRHRLAPAGALPGVCRDSVDAHRHPVRLLEGLVAVGDLAPVAVALANRAAVRAAARRPVRELAHPAGAADAVAGGASRRLVADELLRDGPALRVHVDDVVRSVVLADRVVGIEDPHHRDDRRSVRALRLVDPRRLDERLGAVTALEAVALGRVPDVAGLLEVRRVRDLRAVHALEDHVLEEAALPGLRVVPDHRDVVEHLRLEERLGVIARAARARRTTEQRPVRALVVLRGRDRGARLAALKEPLGLVARLEAVVAARASVVALGWRLVRAVGVVHRLRDERALDAGDRLAVSADEVAAVERVVLARGRLLEERDVAELRDAELRVLLQSGSGALARASRPECYRRRRQ